jgi:predicted amidohydrolase YtcJ
MGDTADLIVLDARIWTGANAYPHSAQPSSDGARASADGAAALAVRSGRVVALGRNDEIEGLRGPRTRIVRAGGRFVMPGFNDAHLHLMTGGLHLEAVSLRDAASPSEFARRIAVRAARHPGEWVTGGDWDEQRWPERALPVRALIDGETPFTPVFVGRYDEHMALANSLALRLAGVSAHTADPPGGAIVRDATGEPTGILKDAAMALVRDVMPPLDRGRRERALTLALRHMASLGVTSAQDMGPAEEDIDLYMSFEAEGRMTVRVRAVPAALPLVEQLASGTVRRAGGDFVRVSGVKAFADGSLGSATALFFEAYEDDPGSRGLLAAEMQPLDAMRTRLLSIDRVGEPLCIHAIGDRAVSMVLDLFEDIDRANGPRDRRPRIEHAQHLVPGDFARFRRLGVIASVQPFHAIDDGRWAEGRIGRERARTTYAFRSFLDHGVTLALGTDWPVAPLDPMSTLYAAVTRAPLDHSRPEGWIPEQKLTVGEALEAYTRGSAYAEFREAEKGLIRVGMLADLVVLSADPFVVPPDVLRELKVAMTVVGGRVVFEDGACSRD